MVDVRRAVAADTDTLGRIMFDAIRSGPSGYTDAQRIAWQDQPNVGADWAARLAKQQVWVAEEQGDAVGFLSLGEGGYVDLAFVEACAQGKGVFSALIASLEIQAVVSGLPRLWTHASVMAQPAFEARGFHVIRHETVERNGEVLARAEMEKTLT